MRSLISKCHATTHLLSHPPPEPPNSQRHTGGQSRGARAEAYCGFCYAPITIKTSQRKLRPPCKSDVVGNGNQENKKNGPKWSQTWRPLLQLIKLVAFALTAKLLSYKRANYGLQQSRETSHNAEQRKTINMTKTHKISTSIPGFLRPLVGCVELAVVFAGSKCASITWWRAAPSPPNPPEIHYHFLQPPESRFLSASSCFVNFNTCTFYRSAFRSKLLAELSHLLAVSVV